MGISTTAMALCVNCGFVGTTLYINGQGPYCGRCANQASGVPMFTSPSARDDDAMREKVKRLIEAARNARNYFCDRYGTGKDNLIVAGKVWQELGSALAEVEKPCAKS
jgi:hypothetical protein